MSAVPLPAWDWSRFQGSSKALGYNRRDLPQLAALVGLTSRRRVVVQAGGHLGIWPKFLSRYFVSVWTFEPSPALFPRLVANAPEDNIYRVQAALSDTHAGVTLSDARRDGKLGPGHEGLTHVAGPGPVPSLRLDALKLAELDLLCLDLEGWELYALRGAIDTLTRCRPVVSVEINKQAALAGVDPADVRALLAALDYGPAATLGSDEVFTPLECSEIPR